MNCQFAELDSEALLHINGPDTLTFLQGQTSCDTRLIDPEHALPGVYCTPKGRVVCDFLLCELETEHFALRLRRSIRHASSVAFGKYIIFSKATLEDSRDDWTVIGIWGSDARSVLSGLFGSVPKQRYGSEGGEGFLLVQVDDAGEAFECYLQQNTAAPFITSRLQKDMTQSDESRWQSLQIQAGIARVTDKLVEAFVPQTLNYDLTGHINFQKGCYTGQEVVARLHYRGTPKRRAFLGTAPANTPCQPGTLVYAGDSQKAIGSIVNCATVEDTHQLLFEAITEETSKALHMDSAAGPRVDLGHLPYTPAIEQGETE